MKDQFPTAMSRQFGEGGYTFLKRTLHAHLQQKAPVILNTGDMYMSYTHAPQHNTFLDGVTVLVGDKDTETFRRFSQVAGSYDVHKGISELVAERKVTVPDGLDGIHLG